MFVYMHLFSVLSPDPLERWFSIHSCQMGWENFVCHDCTGHLGLKLSGSLNCRTEWFKKAQEDCEVSGQSRTSFRVSIFYPQFVGNPPNVTKKSFRTPDQLSYMCKRIWAQDHIFVSLCKHKNGEVPLHHAYCRCPALTVTVTCSCQQIMLTVSVGSNYACGQWSVCGLSPVASDGTRALL